MATAPVTLDEQKRQLRLIWMWMLGAVAAYGAVCFIALRTAEMDGGGGPELLHNVFTVAAIVVGALSVWWWRHFLSADPASAGVDNGMGFSQFQTHSFIVWALSEAVAIVGLMLAFVLRSFQEFVPFGVAGAALLVMHHPFRLPYERLRATAQ